MSEDSLAISTAILAALYAVRQPVSLSRRVAPSLDVSLVLENAEPIERAIADDEAASALGPFLEVNSRINSSGDGGVVAVDFGLRKRGIVMKADGKISSTIRGTQRTWRKKSRPRVLA